MAIFDYFWRFMEIWRAIPDIFDERGCTPLVTTKYEPDMVKTDRDNDVIIWRFSIFCESARL